MNQKNLPVNKKNSTAISNKLLGSLAYIGKLWTLFSIAMFYALVVPWSNPRILRRKSTSAMMLEAGVHSLPILLLINFLVGLILSMQSAYQLKNFEMVQMVSGLVAVTVCREIGPLITAIIISARVGAAITAELGTMVVGEEIMALQTMALRPVPFLVVPRLIALTLMMPCITILADFIGMFGGYCIGVFEIGLPSGQYINGTINTLALADVWSGLVKSIGFGAVIGTVSCHEGLSVQGGAEGVGLATTRSVVVSILFIIITDLIFTIIFYL